MFSNQLGYHVVRKDLSSRLLLHFRSGLIGYKATYHYYIRKLMKEQTSRLFSRVGTNGLNCRKQKSKAVTCIREHNSLILNKIKLAVVSRLYARYI